MSNTNRIIKKKRVNNRIKRHICPEYFNALMFLKDKSGNTNIVEAQKATKEKNCQRKRIY